MKQESTALATRQPQEPFAALAQYQQDRYNVLIPVTTMDELPAATRLSVRVVKVNPSTDAGEVYATENGKLALTGQTLDRVGSAAGITWISVDRTDDRKHPHFCEFRVTGRVIDFDGSVREAIGMRAIDLRDDAGNGEPGADLKEIIYSAENAKDKQGGKSPRDPTKQIMKARQFMVPMCESKAKNRAIRRILSMKGGYTKAELEKPFVVPKLVPDASNPVAQQMMLGQMTGVTAALFGGARALPSKVVDAEFDHGSDSHGDTSRPEGEDKETTAGTAPAAASEEKGTPEILARLTAVWGIAQGANMPIETFRELMSRSCGKTKRAEMTTKDVVAIEVAIEDYVTGGRREPGEDPFA
jgi:hypothetical protein